MKYTNDEYRKLLNKFLKKWSVSKISKMTIDEYHDIGDKNTFCFWIEIATKSLGGIQGVPANKFGIFKRGKSEDLPDKKLFKSDKTYSWYKTYGKTRNVAFNNIKRSILNVISLIKNKKYGEIDDIHLHKFLKWKVAYLFSNEKIVPFFEKELLLFAAKTLGKEFDKKTKISEIQNFINLKRPKNLTVYEFANDINEKYKAVNQNQVRYFIVGSRYGGYKDKFPKMLKNNVVCTGFEPDQDLSFLYGSSDFNINYKLIKLLSKSSDARSAKTALNQFLIMKPGDMIAVKSTGQPRKGKPYLEIKAYATVVERDGKVYYYNEQLGHCINVEFIDTNIKRSFNVGGYGMTVHRLSDKKIISKIFDGYESNATSEVRIKIKRRRRKSLSISKNTGFEKRRGGKPYIADLKHNKIQDEFEKHLVKLYGRNSVHKEKDYVDITLETKNKIILYEIKPYYWAEDCIRTALGQILTYSFFQKYKKQIEIVVIGPNRPDHEEKNIINYIQKNLKIKFKYEHFSNF